MKPGWEYSQLVGVSCTAKNACVAVGSAFPFNASGRRLTVAERWDGRKWALMRTARSGSYDEFNDVSCTSMRACTAVGTTSTGSSWRPLVERWNGKKWLVQPTPNLQKAFLYGVSCASVKDCTAVGRGTGPTALAEHWNGKRWFVQPTPELNGSTSVVSLSSVSCPSARACVAVGLAYVDYRAVAEDWDGQRWTIQSISSPPNATDGLGSVSCVSRTVCMASGSGIAERYS
jgi:hypothetical protein